MFSSREKTILAVLGRRKMTLEEISDEVFKRTKEAKPFDSTISIANTVRRIIKKCQHHGLEWTLEKTRPEGKKLVIKRVII